MNVTQTASVLEKCAAFDQRTVGEGDLAAWHEIIGYLDLADCLAAVTAHYREQTQRAMPADIRKLAIGIRDRRKEGQHLALPAGPTVRDRSPQVTALVEQVVSELPNTTVHDRARERARRERGRPDPALTARRRPENRAKPPKDYPPPVDDEVAKLATRYLIDGHEPAEVADRLGVSRRWCQRTARRFDKQPA